MPRPPSAGALQVLRYLGRYTHRIAISNHRLLAFAGERVTFRWRDYAHGNKSHAMPLHAVEFLRRFFLHVLPKGFVRLPKLRKSRAEFRHVNFFRILSFVRNDLPFRKLNVFFSIRAQSLKRYSFLTEAATMKRCSKARTIRNCGDLRRLRREADTPTPRIRSVEKGESDFAAACDPIAPRKLNVRANIPVSRRMSFSVKATRASQTLLAPSRPPALSTIVRSWTRSISAKCSENASALRFSMWNFAIAHANPLVGRARGP